MGVSVNQDVALLHGRQMILVIDMSMGRVERLSLDGEKGIVRQDGELQHHLVHLRIAVAPNRVNLVF